MKDRRGFITEIVKHQESPRELREIFSDVDAFLWAMFLLYASRPCKQTSEPDGSYFIGSIEEPRLTDQHMERETPYSVCRGIR